VTIKERLKPQSNQLVMKLVAEAGVDVSGWALSKKGAVANPASNPAFCYEWAFVETERVVVLILWHDELTEVGGQVFDDVDPRQWAETDGRPSTRRRAKKFEEAIAHAFLNQVPVRVIVGDGTKRAPSEASGPNQRMERRLLDSEPWRVESYNASTGVARIARGAALKYVDQFVVQEPTDVPRRREVTGEAWVRDPAIRLAALRRAQGKCELCGNLGFRTMSGGIYLETHHVTPLAEGGEDSERNVVALCANDHREAHHGNAREELRSRFRELLDAPAKKLREAP
jgi:5-methylcytosine-specific restriction protein A